MKIQPIPIIVNRKSGIHNQEKKKLIKEAFKELEVLPEIHLVSGDKIVSTVQKLLKNGNTTIIAAGGDGTISTVASQLINTKAVMGVLPMGTMNNFARSIGVNDLTLAAKTIVKHKKKKIDMVEVNGKVFLDDSSIGIYPKLVKKREQKQAKGLHKIPAYFVAFFHVFQRFPTFEVTLYSKGKKLVRKTPVVVVGNNRFKLGKKFEFLSRDRIDEGILSVFFTKKVTRWELFKLFLSLLFGNIYREDKFDAMFTDSVTITSKHTELEVATDGEVEKMKLPLKYKILPKSLNVIVP